MAKNVIGVFTIFLLLLGATLGHAQTRVRVGWAAMTASHTPLWVAQDKGFFAKHGFAAESIFFGAGPPAMQALVAGDLDIVVTSGPNVVNPRLGGADVVMVLSIIPTFIDHIISAPSITNPEQLRGKIGSVNRFGSISDMGMRLSLKKLGIDPEKDVKIVPAGGNPERLAAISKGISQFTIMNEPFIKEAERLGFRDLVNMATLKIPLHGNGLVTREAFIKARRPVIAEFARAITEAIHFIKADKEATKAIIGKYTKLTDPEGLERTYKNYTSVLLDVPYPDPAGIKTLLDDLAPRNPKAAAADPRAFVDLTFVQEMESSGFIKQLYKR
ncbi:MAG TPA: ABC transporter substrate-binding protein [Terriglobales bacterium]|jgi:ABC-type nitrate/sulfonate/bicarbonate transport system substrate-binding protein|nr:ABC transporter substrate-binding protein [Terriglobales bacterium]